MRMMDFEWATFAGGISPSAADGRASDNEAIIQ